MKPTAQLALLLLAGCATTQLTWQPPPGRSPEACQRDWAEAQLAAIQATRQPANVSVYVGQPTAGQSIYSGLSNMGQQIEQRRLNDDVFRLTLQSRGWRLVPQGK